jgi:hypothetical protein
VSVYAELDDGRRLEFPDGTDPGVIQSTVKKLIGASPAPDANAASNRAMLQNSLPMGLGNPDLIFGARQVLDAGAQLGARGLESITSPDSTIGKWAREQRASTEAVNKDALAQYTKNFDPENTPLSSVGRGIGQGVATAPLMAASLPASVASLAAKFPLVAAAGGGAATGAATSALTPVYDPGAFWQQKQTQVASGAKAGALTGSAFNLAGRVLAPSVAPEASQLLNENVSLSPGQAAGGLMKTLEDKATSIPLLGDLIKNRRVEGVESFNKAVYAKALAPFGDEGAAAVKAIPVGNDGIKAVGDFLSNKYETALAQSVPSAVTPEFQSALANLTMMVPSGLRQDFVDAIKTNITSKITPGNTLTPQVAKDAESELGRLYANYKGSSTGSERLLGGALQQAQQELRNLVAANNPQVAPIIQAANQGWRTIAQMEIAGQKASKDGVFTPAQFLAAIREGDKSVRNRQFARGDMLNQNFAQSASRVLPSSVPDSGTIGRGLVGAGLTGGLAHFFSPEAAGGIGAASLGYLPGVSPFIAKMIAGKRPESIGLLGDELKKGAGYLGGMGPAGLLGL